MDTYQDVSLPGTKKRLHRVNYVVAMSFCNKCGEQTCNKCTTTHYFSGLNGGDALSDFFFWGVGLLAIQLISLPRSLHTTQKRMTRILCQPR